METAASFEVRNAPSSYPTDHAMAGVVEQKVLQEVVCLLPGQGLVALMGRQFLLNGLE